MDAPVEDLVLCIGKEDDGLGMVLALLTDPGLVLVRALVIVSQKFACFGLLSLEERRGQRCHGTTTRGSLVFAAWPRAFATRIGARKEVEYGLT